MSKAVRFRLTSMKNILPSIAGSRVSKLITALFRWQPLTFRGILVVLFSAISLKAFAITEMDLIAWILGGGFLAISGLAVIVALIIRIRLRGRLQVEAHFDKKDPRSKQEVPAGLAVSGSSLPPYFYLKLTRSFEHKGVDSKTHILKGREVIGGKRHLIDTLRFRHRGLWSLTHINVTLEDVLGLTSLSWQLPIDSSIEISAPTIAIKALPIVAASSRAGDEWNQSRERSGDMFDTKPYDPSDGVSRILWKTYAKSGELVVRRPEPAIIPEGEVAIYLISETEDDHVAGALQHYLDQLYRQQITVLFGTDGILFQPEKTKTALLKERSSAGKSKTSALSTKLGEGYCTSEAEIQRAINHSVWSEDAGTGLGFATFLESLSSWKKGVHHVIVFAPEEITKRPELWSRIAQSAALKSVKLTLSAVPQEFLQRITPTPLVRGRIGSQSNTNRFSRIQQSLTKKIRRKSRRGATTQSVNSVTSGAGVEFLFVEAQE